MKDYINEFFKKHPKNGDTYKCFPCIKLKGVKMSVQASSHHYCSPRKDLTKGSYKAVEIGFPSRVIKELLPYAENKNSPTKTIYGWVPVSVLNKIIDQRGGINN